MTGQPRMMDRSNTVGRCLTQQGGEIIHASLASNMIKEPLELERCLVLYLKDMEYLRFATQQGDSVCGGQLDPISLGA